MASERIGPYRLLETIAVDRHTVSYRARRSDDGPTVVITTAKATITNRAAVGRMLELEAERLRRLRHPALPTLIERLEDDGVPALVLADHRGHRLHAVLERSQRIEPHAALAIAIELARALALLHHHGEIHGALRPSLVELTASGAVCLHGGRSGTADAADELIAPEHMAPEQILGEPPEARSDVFLLGVLVYRMIAGRGPFDGEGDGISQRIRHQRPPPLQRLAPGLSGAAERVVMRCLAKRPIDRPPDMASLSGRLTQALRAETSLPSEHLIAVALARAGLADPLPAPLDRSASLGASAPKSWLRTTVVPMAAVVVGSLALFAWQHLRPTSSNEAGSARGIVDRPARLRVLARPWAEIHVDGRLVDVTPVGIPIEIPPGRHTILLRHPNAPDELRTIQVIAGQTVLIEVDMKVTAPAAVAPASTDEQEPDDDP